MRNIFLTCFIVYSLSEPLIEFAESVISNQRRSTIFKVCLSLAASVIVF